MGECETALVWCDFAVSECGFAVGECEIARRENEIARRECDFALIGCGSGDVSVVESDSRKKVALQAIFNNGIIKLKELFRCA